MAGLITPDVLIEDFKRQSGEFSVVKQEQFEKHLKRLHLKNIGKVSYEPVWHPWKVQWIDELYIGH